MRQVNGWGFKRIVSGNDHNSYYHELFLRDYPQLCLKMKRIRKGDKLSEAVEEKEQKSGEGNEENDDNDASAESENKEESEDSKDEAEEDGADDQNPPSNAVNAMLNSGSAGQNGLPVSLTSSMRQASIPGSTQNQGIDASTFSTLSGMAAQLQNQQTSQPSASAAPPGGLENNALVKLQEALQGGTGSLLGQQAPQQSQPTQLPPSILGLNIGSLSGLLGNNLNSALAAQLQAATQPPPQNGASANAGGNATSDAPAFALAPFCGGG